MAQAHNNAVSPSLLWFPLAGGKVNRYEKGRKQPGFVKGRLAAAAAPHVIVCRSDLTPGFPSSLFVSDPARPAESWLQPLSADGAPVVDIHKAVFVCEDEVTHRSIFITSAQNVQAGLLSGGTFVSTRDFFTKLDGQGLAVMGLALSMFNWVAAERFCPRCGAALVVRDHGVYQKCSKCKELHFPRLNPAMIVCVLDGKGNVLLSVRKRKSFKAGDKVMRTVLSGFVSHGESQEDTVVREVLEETGANVSWLRYVGSQPWPYPYQLMVSYYALAENSASLTLEAEELVSVGWVPKEEVRQALLGKNPTFFVPPKSSAAGVLLSAWVDGRVNDRGEEICAPAKL